MISEMVSGTSRRCAPSSKNCCHDHDQINDFEVRHNFEQIGPRIMLLNARRLTEGANAENEPLIVLAIEDITTRRGQEELLAARASELLHADRSKDEFLAMLAHELRNPLAPLRNAAEILQTTTATAKQRMEAEDILRRQIENMSRMIDDLLDVARITEGKIELRKEVVVIQTVLAAAVNVAPARHPGARPGTGDEPAGRSNLPSRGCNSLGSGLRQSPRERL